MKDHIRIRGARVNNLKGVDVDIPLNKITCFFGPSGSGKTSLAFHTLYNESKRRFLNSFPTYLKFFSDRPAPVDVDEISPVLPVFGLPQINPVIGTRSNVADIMHLTELFQNLFYHFSEQRCSKHKVPFEEYTISSYFEDFTAKYSDDETFHLFIPRDEFIDFFKELPFPSRSIKSKKAKTISDFDESHELWEITRFKKKHIFKLGDKLEIYLKQKCSISFFCAGEKKLKPIEFSGGNWKCPVDGCKEQAIVNPSMMEFSPYNALGACSKCGGFGEVLEYDEDKLFDLNKSVKDMGVIVLKSNHFRGQQAELEKILKRKKISLTKPLKELPQEFFDILYKGSGQFHGLDAYFAYFERKKYKMNVRVFVRKIQKGTKCSECDGTRLQKFSNQLFLEDQKFVSFKELLDYDVAGLYEYFQANEKVFLNRSKEAKKSIKKIKTLLETAVGIGLGHLELMRKAKTVSAGEYQRLLLLKYFSYEGTGSLFVFDEPSLGLTIKEKKELLKGFKRIIDQKNTVVIIDHSEFFHKKSDYLVHVGPGSGHLGGEIEFAGATSDYPFNKGKIDLAPIGAKKNDWIEVKSPEIYGKKYKNFKLPKNKITWVRGQSGSGKTSCLINILANELSYRNLDKKLDVKFGKFKAITGDTNFKDVIVVDANLNRYTSRSTVGSMTDLFGVLRKHYAKSSMAQALGLTDSHFSYNSDKGQCPKCEGKGHVVIEMQFLEDIVLTCEDCKGKRLKPIYAEISDGNMLVHEAFSKPLSEVLPQIKLTPKFQRIFEYLKILNLDYLAINRQINSLSGGEKQRIYLLNKLQKDISDSILFFENISFGLSEHELLKVCKFLQDLSRKNNTIVIIDQDEIFKFIADHNIQF